MDSQRLSKLKSELIQQANENHSHINVRLAYAEQANYLIQNKTNREGGGRAAQKQNIVNATLEFEELRGHQAQTPAGYAVVRKTQKTAGRELELSRKNLVLHQRQSRHAR